MVGCRAVEEAPVNAVIKIKFVQVIGKRKISGIKKPAW